MFTGCAAVDLAVMASKAPSHTSYDYETGSYIPDNGYHWEYDANGKGTVVKDK